jgi:DNA helicase HerA-like ATPase
MKKGKLSSSAPSILDIGTILNASNKKPKGQIAGILASQLKKHMAILAQSGSGKSFFLGRLIEEIVLRTRARVLIFDPNSDFVNFRAISPTTWKAPYLQRWFPPSDTQAMFQSIWEKKHITVLSNRFVESGTLIRVHWGDLVLDEMISFLGIDQRYDPDLYWYLRSNRLMAEELWEHGETRPYDFTFFETIANKIQEVLLGGNSLANFGEYAINRILKQSVGTQTSLRYTSILSRLSEYDIWAQETATDIRSALFDDGGCQLAVVDLQSLKYDHEKLLVVNQVLSRLWEEAKEGARERLQNAGQPDERVPTFVVVDEAQNLIPQQPTDEPAKAVVRQIERFAAEGRKYGIYLIVSTQRPQKVSANVLSECDNACLLRMTNAEDIDYAKRLFGYLPKNVFGLCPRLTTGEVLLCGAFVSNPLLIHSAPRRTIEGGANLDDTFWTQPLP